MLIGQKVPETKQEKVLHAGNVLFDTLQAIMESKPDIEVGMALGLQIIGAKEGWLKATNQK